MPKINIQRLPIRYIALWGIVLVLALGLFNFTRDFTTCWRVTSLPGTAPKSCGDNVVDVIGTPVIIDQHIATATSTQEPEVPQDSEFPTWDGGSRLNILFVGLRGGDPAEHDCPLCTDTLILLTIDPVTKTAGMLSIPRDLWVNIPGFGYSRINTAWTLGQGSKLPGGGPGLTMKTVSHVIGVPIDHYVQVDFDTFVGIIDLIGGVDVYNDQNLRLDRVGSGKDKIRLTCCGIRHLDGTAALAYARCRHLEQGCTDGDIGRARRQQKVIFGIREKVLDPENFPKLLAQAPQFYNKFSEGIHTNLSLDDAMKLAVLMRDIPVGKINNKVIDDSMMVLDMVILDGQKASVIRPFPDKIRILRDEMFTSSGALSPLAQGDPTALMQADGAHIRILNATAVAQLDTRTGAYLSQQGLQITEFGNTKAASRTTITIFSPKLYALRFLVNLFDIKSPQILIKPDPTQTVDIEIHLGTDWIKKLPAGY